MAISRDPRTASEQDWPDLRTALNRVFRPKGGDLTVDSPLLFAAENRHNLHVLTAGAEAGSFAPIAAHAGILIRQASVFGRRVGIACIGAVMTVPPLRGQGLGSRLLGDALVPIGSDADLVLASGDRGLYRRHGLNPQPPLARFRLPPRHGAVAAGVEIRDAMADDLEAMAVLYDAEQVHFVRSAADWRLLWAAGHLLDAPARFSLVLRSGRAVAYVGVQSPRPLPEGPPRPARILEAAGDRAAIADAAPLLAEELLAPAYDISTIAECERRGWPRGPHSFPITAKACCAYDDVVPWYGLNYL